MIGFVDGIQQINRDDGNVDFATVFGPSGGSRRGVGVACADEDAVEDCLRPACYQLRECVS